MAGSSPWSRAEDAAERSKATLIEIGTADVEQGEHFVRGMSSLLAHWLFLMPTDNLA
jgi:hypothetical protein